MENRGIISKVDYPTEFVNAMIVVEKSNGDLRICIDPRKLNEQIMREHFAIPLMMIFCLDLTERSYFQ